jgi:hypothetical protein
VWSSYDDKQNQKVYFYDFGFNDAD